jgi:putative tryptophan/tyrosine transport system substrate-binding protein
MRRRDFILVVGTVVACPFAGRAQQRERIARLGLLSTIKETDPEAQAMVTALDRGLNELGWVPGRNLSIERRWGAGDPRRIAALAKELVALQPDVCVAYSTLSVFALKKETSTIPIVFVQVSDPIGSGFIANLAHPGGNITGFTNFEASMVGKWAELLKEIAPTITRIAYLFNPETAPYVPRFYQKPLEASARALGIEIEANPVHSAGEIEAVVAALGSPTGGALILLPDSFNILHRAKIASLTAEHRVPAISPYRFAATEGGLMAYGVDQVELFRHAAGYVDRLLKGAKPGDLPVQAPTKFDLVINLETARALGLAVPPYLLSAADEVIQ